MAPKKPTAKSKIENKTKQIVYLTLIFLLLVPLCLGFFMAEISQNLAIVATSTTTTGEKSATTDCGCSDGVDNNGDGLDLTCASSLCDPVNPMECGWNNNNCSGSCGADGNCTGGCYGEVKPKPYNDPTRRCTQSGGGGGQPTCGSGCFKNLSCGPVAAPSGAGYCLATNVDCLKTDANPNIPEPYIGGSYWSLDNYDPGVKGRIIGNESVSSRKVVTYEDFCQDDRTLKEYYCNRILNSVDYQNCGQFYNRFYVAAKTITCNGVCVEGTCQACALLKKEGGQVVFKNPLDSSVVKTGTINVVFIPSNFSDVTQFSSQIKSAAGQYLFDGGIFDTDKINFYAVNLPTWNSNNFWDKVNQIKTVINAVVTLLSGELKKNFLGKDITNQAKFYTLLVASIDAIMNGSNCFPLESNNQLQARVFICWNDAGQELAKKVCGLDNASNLQTLVVHNNTTNDWPNYGNNPFSFQLAATLASPPSNQSFNFAANFHTPVLTKVGGDFRIMGKYLRNYLANHIFKLGDTYWPDPTKSIVDQPGININTPASTTLDFNNLNLYSLPGYNFNNQLLNFNFTKPSNPNNIVNLMGLCLDYALKPLDDCFIAGNNCTTHRKYYEDTINGIFNNCVTSSAVVLKCRDDFVTNATNCHNAGRDCLSVNYNSTQTALSTFKGCLMTGWNGINNAYFNSTFQSCINGCSTAACYNGCLSNSSSYISGLYQCVSDCDQTGALTNNLNTCYTDVTQQYFNITLANCFKTCIDPGNHGCFADCYSSNQKTLSNNLSTCIDTAYRLSTQGFLGNINNCLSVCDHKDSNCLQSCYSSNQNSFNQLGRCLKGCDTTHPEFISNLNNCYNIQSNYVTTALNGSASCLSQNLQCLKVNVFDIAYKCLGDSVSTVNNVCIAEKLANTCTDKIRSIPAPTNDQKSQLNCLGLMFDTAFGYFKIPDPKPVTATAWAVTSTLRILRECGYNDCPNWNSITGVSDNPGCYFGYGIGGLVSVPYNDDMMFNLDSTKIGDVNKFFACCVYLQKTGSWPSFCGSFSQADCNKDWIRKITNDTWDRITIIDIKPGDISSSLINVENSASTNLTKQLIKFFRGTGTYSRSLSFIQAMVPVYVSFDLFVKGSSGDLFSIGAGLVKNAINPKSKEAITGAVASACDSIAPDFTSCFNGIPNQCTDHCNKNDIANQIECAWCYVWQVSKCTAKLRTDQLTCAATKIFKDTLNDFIFDVNSNDIIKSMKIMIR